MGIDTGKLAKNFGRSHPRDARKVDQDPARVPPHKKPREYKLTVKFERITVSTYTKTFVSKAAMQEFRKRAERVLEERRKKDELKKVQRYSWLDNYYDLRMDMEESESFKSPPVITEEMIDGSPNKSLPEQKT